MSTTPAASVRAASFALPASLAAPGAVVLGTAPGDNADATSGAIKLGSMTSVRFQGTYTRNAGSTTGRPIFAVDVSMDPPTTSPASVARWVPVMLLDNSTFSSGRIDGFAYAFSPAPSVTSATSQGTPPFSVAGAQWMRVRMSDVDATDRGAISLLVFGGEASP